MHGGGRRAAAARYGIAEADWLDLSTGIAPWAWPVPPLPDEVWARLPEADDGLLAAAADYYGCAVDRLVALPGSQFAIRELPRLFAPSTVAIPTTGYTEHAHAWRAAGHRLRFYDDLAALRNDLDAVDHAVLLHPNNPTGEFADLGVLDDIARGLGDGRLIIDAAFADCLTDEQTRCAWPPGAIALRSVGKFFGLAGMRLGFAFGSAPEIEALRRAVEPWGVAHPARWIGRRALADSRWQTAQHGRIRAGEVWLRDALGRAWPDARISSAGLFVTLWFGNSLAAPTIHEALAAQGVLTRLGDDRRWLRLGLPRESDRARLAAALARSA